MKKVFKIVKYNLIGQVLYTCIERPDLEARPHPKYPNDIEYYEKDTNNVAFRNHLFELSVTPKKDALSPNDKFLPYFANVTEDVPQRHKLHAKTYKNCQLMTEKHGGYLQFWHEPTQQVLRIAMNSHFYQPITE